MGEPGKAQPTPRLPAACVPLGHPPPLPARPPALGWPRPRGCGRLWFPGVAAVFEDALQRCPQTVFLLSPSLRPPLPAPAPCLFARCRPGREELGRGAPSVSPSASGSKVLQRRLSPSPTRQPPAVRSLTLGCLSWKVGPTCFPSSIVGRIPGDARGARVGSLAQSGCEESI